MHIWSHIQSDSELREINMKWSEKIHEHIHTDRPYGLASVCSGQKLIFLFYFGYALFLLLFRLILIGIIEHNLINTVNNSNVQINFLFGNGNCICVIPLCIDSTIMRDSIRMLKPNSKSVKFTARRTSKTLIFFRVTLTVCERSQCM